jgi:translation initiation factor 1
VARVKVVYSTGTAGRCPGCGWPTRDCRCSNATEEPVPSVVVARLRIEKSGRAGKTVTVVDGLPRNRTFLDALATELKRACGAGGTVGDDRVEIQGDHRPALRTLLERKGFRVRG